MEQPNGIQWPGWKTVRLIGQGSFGAVYEIERELFGKTEKAALKHIALPQSQAEIEELYSEGYDDASITATFRSHLESIIAEYSLMRKLNGFSNVVNCDDVQYIQRQDGFGWDIYIKMELLTPLTKALPDPIPAQTTVKLARDLCQALVQCRRLHIVHRDIKPQNIFVSPLGDYKLGDFSIAKTIEKTTGGTKTGTYNYMAPEVYHNQPYGHSADIYSLGLVLYWMLNQKRKPFLPLPPAVLSTGMDEQARNRRLSGEPLPPPAEGSEALRRIVLKACAYDPADRYRTAEEMLADLNELDGGSAYSAGEATVYERFVPLPAEERTEEQAQTVGRAGQSPTPESEAGTRGQKRPAPRPAPAVGEKRESPGKPADRRPPQAAPASAPAQPLGTQKPKKNWLLPAVILAGLLLAGLIAVLVLNRNKPAPSAADSAADTQTAPAADASAEPTADTAAPDDAQNETQTAAAFMPGVHTYACVQSACSWDEARQDAADRGGHLVCFETEEEYIYVLALLEAKNSQLCYVRIGARRDADRTAYYWRDAQDLPYGDCLNSAEAWCAKIWMPGEPSLTWKGTEETCCVLEYNWTDLIWELNDEPDAVSEELNSDTVGYIIEFEDAAAR